MEPRGAHDYPSIEELRPLLIPTAEGDRWDEGELPQAVLNLEDHTALARCEALLQLAVVNGRSLDGTSAARAAALREILLELLPKELDHPFCSVLRVLAGLEPGTAGRRREQRQEVAGRVLGGERYAVTSRSVRRRVKESCWPWLFDRLIEREVRERRTSGLAFPGRSDPTVESFHANPAASGMALVDQFEAVSDVGEGERLARNLPAERRAEESHPDPDGVHLPAFLGRVKRSLDRYGQLIDSESLLLVEGVEKRVVQVNTTYQAGDYDSASALLVTLIGDAAALAAAQNGRAEPRVLGVEVWTYRAAAMLASRCGDAGTARLAADRAVAAATHSGSPLLQGIAMYQVACALNLANELESAQQAASDGAEMLFRRGDRASPAEISVRGALLLLAAIIAARRGERRESAHQLAEAERMADELGVDANHAWTAFGPTNVRTHALAAAVALGDVDRAIEIGEAIEPDRFPRGLIGRRCQVHLDTACAYAERRHDCEAVIHLLLAEATGPQVIRYNPQVRRLVGNLLDRERRPATPGLRYLARQVGMTS
jgi:hypothetical protein